MRNLTSNEKRLLTILGAAVFVAGNLVLLRSLSITLRERQGEIKRLNTTVEASEAVLAHEAFWQQRLDWIEEHPPPNYEPGVTDSALLESVQRSLQSHDITIQEQRLLSPIRSGNSVEIVLAFRFTGGLESLIRWLVELQQPGAYYRVRSFTLKSDDDASKINCSLEISRFFAMASQPNDS